MENKIDSSGSCWNCKHLVRIYLNNNREVEQPNFYLCVAYAANNFEGQRPCEGMIEGHLRCECSLWDETKFPGAQYQVIEFTNFNGIFTEQNK